MLFYYFFKYLFFYSIDITTCYKKWLSVSTKEVKWLEKSFFEREPIQKNNSKNTFHVFKKSCRLHIESLDDTVCFADLGNLNLLWWFDLKLKPILLLPNGL